MAEKSGAGFYRLSVLGSATEYFLLEYRYSTGYDSSLPGGGIVIWHIDDTIGGGGASHSDFSCDGCNNLSLDPAHPRVLLVQADKGTIGSHLPANTGDAGDPFSKPGDLFTSPQSDSYSGIISNITISGFSGYWTPAMKADITMMNSATTLALKEIKAFPNPAKGSAVKSVIRFTLSRPLSSGSISIYNAAGELVFTDNFGQKNLNMQESTKTGVWIYEYPWNLSNNSGRKAGSGIYIYSLLIESPDNSVTATGKIAVVR